MEPPVSPLVFSGLLFVGMLILLEAGRRLGVRRRGEELEGERGSLGTIEGAIFALFGLLMAFTFSGAALRFNEKRMLIAEEANTGPHTCACTWYLRQSRDCKNCSGDIWTRGLRPIAECQT